MERKSIWPVILAAVVPVLLRAMVVALATAGVALGLLPDAAVRCLDAVPAALLVPFGL